MNKHVNQRTFFVTEHLKGFSAVNVNAKIATAALEENLRRFGPVAQSNFASFREALEYLLPIKSFTTRFLVLGLGDWSLLITDMREQNCYVDAYAISRVTLSNAIGVFLQEQRREFHLFEEGRKVREVQSSLDGDKWYYRELGALQPFEDLQECVRKRKSDRLSLEALRHYFCNYTDMQIPDWKKIKFTSIYGLERSIKELKAPLTLFETVNNLYD